jgi:hypothetical protein
MLACFCADNLAGFSEDNLPGQPLTSQTAQSLLPWDPGSASPHQPSGQPPSNDEERFSLPRRRGANFEPEPPERRRRPARLPSPDEEEEDEKLTSEAQFRRLSNAPGLQQGMGQGPVKRPASKVLQPTPGGTTSMASQLKVQFCCCSACSALSLFACTTGAYDCMYCYEVCHDAALRQCHTLSAVCCA